MVGNTFSVVDKRRIKKEEWWLKRVETWQLIIILILVGFVAASFLRLNNIGMSERRQAVINADKSGNKEDIQARIYDLQRYVSSHMNATTGVFYLQQQYNRDVQKAAEAASADSNPNGNINKKVDEICRSRVSGYGPEWFACFRDELAKFPAAPDPAKAIDLPDPSLYRVSYTSPTWSLDFAGGAVALAGLIAVVIVVRLLALGVLHLMLKWQYRGV